MLDALIGKCSGCGRKNDWNDVECPGCHVKRRPWLPILGLLAGTGLAAAVLSLMF